MTRRLIKLLPFIVFLGLALFLWRGLSLSPQEIPSPKVGKPLPQFSLPLLDNAQSSLTHENMPNQVYLINVWASWCHGCSEEQVFLMQLNRNGYLIYGINYKDNPEDAVTWLKNWGNPYQAVGADEAGRFAMDLGVYGAPETFLVDAKGFIQHRHAGPLNQAVWQNEFLPRIAQLKG